MNNVHPGDHIYFRTRTGPACGKVLCHGKHGCHVEHDGKLHKVRWEHVLGHKQRITPAVTVVDQGDDGAIIEDGKGKRSYVHGLEPPEEPETEDEDPTGWDWLKGRKMVKAMPDNVAVLFLKSGGIKNRPGLSLQEVTDKLGHVSKRWKRTGADEKKERPNGALEREKRGAKHGYGTQRVEVGDTAEFNTGHQAGSGKIVSTGPDGATIQDDSGEEHKVYWKEITNHKRGGGSAGAERTKAFSSDPRQGHGKQEPIPAADFKASAYFEDHNDADVTADDILNGFPPEAKQAIDQANDRLSHIEQTVNLFKKNGRYTGDRNERHAKIFREILSPENIEKATPAPGEKPTVVFLGGRGGSGKSKFTESKEGGGLGMFDESKFIVLDADKIKVELPEYLGWNAAQVHEESSDILDEIKERAEKMGLNVIVDATLKTTDKAVASVKHFKDLGYSVEVHYMRLPRHEAAKRAVSRFMNGGTEKDRRYVPVGVVLGNETNEASFDAVRKIADKWSFRDNNVERGEQPILISEGGKDMQKAVILFCVR